MSNILTTLSKLQKELKAPKGQFNKFGGYHYRSCEDILEAVKPMLPEGYAILLTDEIVPIIQGEGNHNRVYIRATATLAGPSEDGDPIQAVAYAREPFDKKGMDDSQITGSTASYARKYALNGLLALSDTADADATNDHGKGQSADMSNSSPVEDKPAAAPSDMKADERSQILDGSYQMPFGRNKGVALMDLATSEIEGTITYMESKLVPGKWYKANAAKIEAFKQYLDKRVNSEATGDETELDVEDEDQVPF